MDATASGPLPDSPTTRKPSSSSMLRSILRTWSVSSTSMTLIASSAGSGATNGTVASAGVNLASIVDGHPDDAVAVVSRGVATTYRELTDEVARVRGGLASAGLRPGDRVAVLCANNRLFVVSYL